MMAASISSTGRARDLLRAAIRGELEVWWSEQVVEETQRNLGGKAPEALPDFYDFILTLTLLQPQQVAVPARRTVQRAARIVDAKDAPIVAAAAACEADYLATYDRRHLLARAEEIQRAFGVRVVTPDKALADD